MREFALQVVEAGAVKFDLGKAFAVVIRQ